MNQDKKSRLIAIIVTLLVHILVALLLWLMHFGYTHVDDESGILVMVGVDAVGGVNEAISSNITDLEAEPQPETVEPAPTPAPATAPTTPAPSPEPALTQDDDTAPYAAEQEKKEKEKKLREQQELEKQRLAEAERIRLEELRKQQEAEAKRIAEEEAKRKAEEERKQQESQRINNQLAGLFNNNGTGGESGLQGQQNGNSTTGAASGSPGYGDYDLGGRGLRGSLPRPSFNKNITGKVVLFISVDAQGNVVGEPTVGTGTTIADQDIRKAAVDAAKRAKFTPIKGTSTTPGKITYYFDSNN